MTKFNPAFDMPTTPEEAMAVLAVWSSPTCLTFSAERTKQIFYLLSPVIHQALKNQ